MTPDSWLRAMAERVIQTSCATLYLGDGVAWKVKRPVDLGFLDFTTLDKRAWALERELAFNAAAAPDIYRSVRRITCTADGFCFDGEGEGVEFALEMRRFDEGAVLDVIPEAVDGELAEALGRTTARLHATAPLSQGGGAGALGYTIGSNAEHLRALAPMLGAEAVETLIERTQAAFEAATPLLEERRGQGFSRRCHGDLHLGNILLENGAPVLFDCIEFNDQLCEIDVLYDLAFLLMDLDFRGRRDAAVRVLSAYLDEAGRTVTDGLYEGLALLPLMLSVRGAVRCHVRAHAGDKAGARAYLHAALRHLGLAPPVLVAVGGYSGSGKSTFARAIAPLLGASPGAVVLRSDEIRKRLWGVPPTERLPKEAYGSKVGKRVYRALYEEAECALKAGRAVVLDAVFMKAAERDKAAAIAARCGVPFEGVWLEAPEAVLRARVGARKNDASDADLAVLAMQLKQQPGELGWRLLDAEGDFVQLAEAMAARLGD
jgi:aminoglycoside phosphotransferase family enzyme/predicted kinase